jgi:hypothetical protein
MEGQPTENGETPKGKALVVKLSPKAARGLEVIKERILSTICGDNEKCREVYRPTLSNAGILAALIDMVLYDNCIFAELARRVAIRDEYTYGKVMALLSKCRREPPAGEVGEVQSKYQAVTTQCTDPQKCLEEFETSAEEVRKLLGSEE